MKPLRASICAGVAIAATWTGPAAAATTDRLQIDLKPHARVATDVVRLGDVAEVRTNDIESARALTNIALGDAPMSGEPMRVSRQRVASWLAKQAELKGVVWSLTGSPHVSIERATQLLAGAEVEAVAQKALDAWLRAQAAQHTAEVTSAVAAARIPEGEWSLQARDWAPGLQPSRHMRVWVDVSVAGRPVRTIAVDFRVQAQGPRWVMQRDAAPGQTLSEADVALELADLTLVSAPAPAKSPVGLALKLKVRAGQVLHANHVAPRPAVERGSEVTMHSKAGLITLTTTALALQSGQPGQRIRVQPTGARNWVEALVVSTASVEVSP